MAARDLVVIAMTLFGLGLAFFILHYVGTIYTETMIAEPQINQTEQVVEAYDGLNKTLSRLDYLMLGVFIGLTLAYIITGWFIGGNPIFMFIYFLVTVVTTVVATIIANVWVDMTGAAEFGTTIAAFPITNHLLSNLPYYVAVLGFIGIVVMFAKPYFMGAQGGGEY